MPSNRIRSHKHKVNTCGSLYKQEKQNNNSFTPGAVEHWNKLPREVMEFLEMLKSNWTHL